MSLNYITQKIPDAGDMSSGKRKKTLRIRVHVEACSTSIGRNKGSPKQPG